MLSCDERRKLIFRGMAIVECYGVAGAIQFAQWCQKLSGEDIEQMLLDVNSERNVFPSYNDAIEQYFESTDSMLIRYWSGQARRLDLFENEFNFSKHGNNK